jgi:hypothetical protein
MLYIRDQNDHERISGYIPANPASGIDDEVNPIIGLK